MAEQMWYYTRGGQQAGPVSFSQLQQLVASGQVGPQDMVWNEGLANWQPAGSVPELGGGPGGPVVGDPGAAPGGYAPAGYQQPVGYGGYPAPGGVGADSSGKATTGFVFSLFGLFCCGVIFGTVGLVLGMMAQKEMARSGNYKGKGLATAAVIIGIIDIPVNIIGSILYYSTMHGRHF